MFNIDEIVKVGNETQQFFKKLDRYEKRISKDLHIV